MSLSNIEKMDILLQQLEMPEEVVAGPLKNSELHKVIVMKSKQTWHFYIRVEKTLPFDIYHLLVEKLKTDRKSTRLNSSHVSISYAVFCLKNKNNISDHFSNFNLYDVLT